MSDVPPPGSPIDRMDVPDRLSSWVVKPGPLPTIHGYEVDSDLAANYSFAETTLLALTGTVPTRSVGCCFEIALTVASAVTVAEAPVHAAALAALCGGKTAGVAATGAIALTQQAQAVVVANEALLTWLNGGCSGPPPAESCGEVCPRGRRLRASLKRSGADIIALCEPLLWHPALLATFHYCGLTQPWQLETAIASARWPVAVAEAVAGRHSGLKSYPIRTPPFRYKT